MIPTIARPWEAKRTEETGQIEKLLRDAGFEDVAAYRYNPASIRLRVIDPRFEGLAIQDRDAMVEPILEKLPERTQADLMILLTFAPSEVVQTPATIRDYVKNLEFEDPSPSIL